MQKLDDDTYGQELIINLAGCNPETIRSGEKIKEFAASLCELIKMRAYGEPLVVHFGHDELKTAGYSLVQLIETSSITGHFSEDWNKAYLNVFSCKEFDADEAYEFTASFFGAKSGSHELLIRK